jgi:catechol 2,3-dioxygenase
MTAGENLETSDGLRIAAPSGHVIEIYHGMTVVGTEVGTHNPEVFPRHLVGVGAPRIDHALITAEDVKLADRFFAEVLGFYASERVVTSLEHRPRHRRHRRAERQAAPLRVRAGRLVGDQAGG